MDIGKIPATGSKLPDIGTTIFTVMSQLALDHDAINLSQGFPDFAAPADLLERVTHYLHTGHNQYAPMTGAPQLREAIARKIADNYQLQVNPDSEITVTSGATSALFCAIEAFIHPGDEAIIFDPAYDSYEPAIRLAGGHAVRVPLQAPSYAIDWEYVNSLVSDRTAMIIINSPHNPTGSVIDADDMANLKNVVRDTDIIILSDEVYEHIVFDGQRHESLLRDAELAARSLVVSSFGKTYHATGWKIGYCVAAPHISQRFRQVHQFAQFCVVTPIQLALADYLDNYPKHYLELGEFYQQKRDRFAGLLRDSRFNLMPCKGTYFQLADYSEISDASDIEFSRWMTIEKGVATIPISVFYAEAPTQKIVRFCFAKADDTLEKAAEILCRI